MRNLRRMRLRIAAGIGLAAALALAGCGGNLDNNSKLGINDWDELVSDADRGGKISTASATTYADLFKNF